MKTCRKGTHTYADTLRQCPECLASANSKYSAKMAGKRYKNGPKGFAALAKSHGIDVETVARQINKQNRLCAGCQNKLDFGKLMHIDHCHETGKFRGMLCHNCNIALGLVKDKPSTLIRLLAYLHGQTLSEYAKRGRSW